MTRWNKNYSWLAVVFVLVLAFLWLTDFSLPKKLVGYNGPSFEASSEFKFLSLPSGFSISAYAGELKGPRVIAFDPAGRMAVSETGAGRVTILEDTDKDGKADNKKYLISGLNNPHGLVFKCGRDSCILFVAETNRVMAYNYDIDHVAISNGRKIADLPSGGGHFTRTLMFVPGSDTELLVSVGSSCNVCTESDARRAKILKVDTTTGKTEEFASGLRNAVFMTLSPDNKIWATEMGRDNLGDNLPPDELNIITQGKNYGWPVCYGNKIHDTQFDKKQYVRDPCSDTEAPTVEIPAHSAPLGLAFIDNKKWPKDWRGKLLVAYHGSWNRSIPTGYKIVMYEFGNDNNVARSEDFISGWLDQGKIHGRPVDLKFGPDGALYVSDDKAGLMYKVTPR